MNSENKTPEQIYSEWKQSLKEPNDSIFYYHPSLERIILGLSMYEIASRPYLSKLGKAESMKLYNNYINEMVTAWIDNSGTDFEYPFTALMKLCEAFHLTSNAFGFKHPELKKWMLTLQYTFLYWIPIAGDMSEEKAEALLDDITTDGNRIDSEHIACLVRKIQHIVVSRGMDLDLEEGLRLIEEA